MRFARVLMGVGALALSDLADPAFAQQARCSDEAASIISSVGGAQ